MQYLIHEVSAAKTEVGSAAGAVSKLCGVTVDQGRGEGPHTHSSVYFFRSAKSKGERNGHHMQGGITRYTF